MSCFAERGSATREIPFFIFSITRATSHIQQISVSYKYIQEHKIHISRGENNYEVRRIQITRRPDQRHELHPNRNRDVQVGNGSSRVSSSHKRIFSKRKNQAGSNQTTPAEESYCCSRWGNIST